MCWPPAASTLQRVIAAKLIDRAVSDSWETRGVAVGDTQAQPGPALAGMQGTDASGIAAVRRYTDSPPHVGASTAPTKTVQRAARTHRPHTSGGRQG
ncbi:hypothetical protein BU225_20015, partial [Stenotrophomonas sp. MB339]